MVSLLFGSIQVSEFISMIEAVSVNMIIFVELYISFLEPE
jgi:hypothetical protein